MGSQVQKGNRGRQETGAGLRWPGTAIEKGYSSQATPTSGTSSVTSLAVNRCLDVLGAADWWLNPEWQMDGLQESSCPRPCSLLETCRLVPATRLLLALQ